MQEEICIRISQERMGSDKINVTATLSKAHRSVAGMKMVPLKTVTARMPAPYASGLTPGLLAAMWDAIRAVAAGYYDNEELPFG